MTTDRTDNGYTLLDHGDGRKLESFGGIVLDRPAPQATGRRFAPQLWSPAHAVFTRDHSGGRWAHLKHFTEPWLTNFGDIDFELGLSPQGQVGFFPEQAGNWRWIREVIGIADREADLLNLFGYTGGATIAALTAPTPHRISICHVDGSKSAVAWARRNALHNGKEDAPVRWIVDDAATFLLRESRRGRRYDGIVLDPPAFGRGPDGSRWKLKEGLPRLLTLTAALLTENPLFLLFSCHDPTLSIGAIRKEIKTMIGRPFRSLESISLEIPCAAGSTLPAGMTIRVLF